MNFRFEPLKTTQAAAFLLTLEERVMDRMRLLKLLYIADRELLMSKGRTLTGDRAVAMNYGPVLSHTYNLIKGNEQSLDDWNKYIRSVNRKLVLMGDPGRGELSKREVDKLKEVSNRFREISTSGLSAVTHEFSEWSKNFVPDTSTPIPWADALEDMGSADKVALFEEKLAEQELIDSIFALPTDGKKELSLSDLETLAEIGRLQKRTPVPPALLQRIRNGAMISDDCKDKYKQFLLKQGLITKPSQ